jgi:tetratricopeptide (TPR) repeat protein
MGIRITPGKQKETFKLVHKMGTEAIRKVILSYDESVLGSLTKAASEMGERYQQEVKSFSEEALRRLSDKLFHQGTKAFTLRKYDEAGEKFSGSILLFRDNILSYVNLARIMKTLGNRREAESNYDNALIMLSLFDYEGNDTMRKVIEEERQARKKVMEPILSLGELMSGA